MIPNSWGVVWEGHTPEDMHTHVPEDMPRGSLKTVSAVVTAGHRPRAHLLSGQGRSKETARRQQRG